MNYMRDFGLLVVLCAGLAGGCAWVDYAPPKSASSSGLIATPASYYSTTKARYLGTKYKEHLDRLIERIVRNPKTSNLQFANNISSVGGIGFFTHSATKSPDERYLEVVMGTPETFEMKGAHSQKIARLFTLYGEALLATLGNDEDIFQDKELAGYGLNLAWRNVVPEASGNRVVMERAIAYFPKERVRGFLRRKISQNEILSDAVIFAVEENGPLQLVSYRPQEVHADFRPAIRVDNLPKEDPASASTSPLKDAGSNTGELVKGGETEPAEMKQPSLTPAVKSTVVETPAVAKAPTAVERENPPVAPQPAAAPAVAPPVETIAILPPVGEQVVEKPSAGAGVPIDQPEVENRQQVHSEPMQSAAEPVIAEAKKSATTETSPRESSVPPAPVSKATMPKKQDPLAVLPAPQMATRESMKPAPGSEATKTKPAVVVAKTESPEAAPKVALVRPSAQPTPEARARTPIGTSSPPAATVTSREEPVDVKKPPSVPTTARAESRPAAVKPQVEIPAPQSPVTSSEAKPAAELAPAPVIKMPEREKAAPLPSPTKVEPPTVAAGLKAPAMPSPPGETVGEKSAGERLALLPKRPSEAPPQIKPLIRPAPRALEGYIVQLAFSDKEKALRWAENMERRGYAVSITEAGTEGALRVRLGNFAQRDEAERQLRTFQKEGLIGIVVNLPQGFRPEARSSVP